MRWIITEITYYSKFKFIHSKLSFLFLLLIQLAGFGVLAYGLFDFYSYDALIEWTLPVIWCVMILATLTCTFSTITNIVNFTFYIKLSVLFVLISFLAMDATIAILVYTKYDVIRDLEYCNQSPATVPAGQCVDVFGQPFCGVNIHLQCDRTNIGFYKILAGQITAVITTLTFAIFSILNLISIDTKKRYSLIPEIN